MIFFRIQTPLAMDQWAWTRQQAVRYLGINMACGALVGVTCFGCIGPLAKKFDDRKLLIFIGLIPLIIGKIVLIPMGSGKPLYIDPQGISWFDSLIVQYQIRNTTFVKISKLII